MQSAVPQQASLPPVSMNTVFLVDWDDTLLPTSPLQGHGAANETMKTMLADIDAAASQVLEAALAVPGADVTLLTNACLDWVWTSSRSHLPEVHKILRSGNVSVLSARPSCPAGTGGATEAEREARQAQHAKSSVEWKDATVRGPLARRLCGRWERKKREMQRQQAPAPAPASDLPAFQVVTIGDSPHDLEAGKTLAQLLERPATEEAVKVKTVQMQPAPTAPELLAQLRVLLRTLPALARRPTSLECSMCRKPPTPPQRPAKAPEEMSEALGSGHFSKVADKGRDVGADLVRTCAVGAALVATTHSVTAAEAVTAAA
jgi:hypothetical protein